MGSGSIAGRTAGLVLCLAMALAGCGGSGGEAAAEAPTGVARIGPAGGTVDGPDGARIVAPAGAVVEPMNLRLAKDGTGAPALPAGGTLRAVSNVYAALPHGTGFAEPVTLTLPIDPALVPAGADLVVLKAAPGGEWRILTDVRRDGDTVSVAAKDFSHFMVAARSVERSGELFRFDLSVTGTAPNLTVAYAFRGTLPACSGGLVLKTWFRYVYSYFDGTDNPLYAAGNTAYAISADQQGHAMAGWNGQPLVQQALVQPMLPPDMLVQRATSRTSAYYDPFVEGRLSCLGSQAAGPGGGEIWTQRSANTVNLGKHVGPVALLQDIDAPTVAPGERAPSSAVAQARIAPESSDALARNRLGTESSWQLSRDGGATWTPLATATGVDTVDEWAGRPIGSATGVYRLATTLPDFAAGLDGAHVRVLACNGVCAAGAPQRVTVLASAVAPQFTLQPVSTTVTVGAPAQLTATASGQPAARLQWQVRDAVGDWHDIAGATAPTFTVNAASLADDGRLFRAVATNEAGVVTSAVAQLSVVGVPVAPAISGLSGDLTVAPGGTAVFAATVGGTAPLSFQWRRDGVAITGANTPILRLDAVTSAQGGRYTLEVGNAAGTAVSAPMVLALGGSAAGGAPTIAAVPASLTVAEGATAMFAVSATAPDGGGTLAFQWFRDGTAIAGATAPVLTVVTASGADQGAYTVRVSNAAGTTTSSAALLAVNAAPAAVAPSITTPPASVVVLPGGSATLAVAANGSAPLSFQWQHDGADIAGANQPVLALGGASAVPLRAGAYSVLVSNAAGRTVSAAASVIVLGAPEITVQPADQAAVEGGSATFAVTAGGSQLRYQWLRNGVAIAGANGASFTTPTLVLADSGAVYGVIVYNGTDLVFSRPALLTVSAPPVGNAAGRLATGLNHSCAVRADGSAACWGANANGQLGNGGTGSASSPVAWTLPEPVQAVAAGITSSCALTATTGRVFCSGFVADNASTPTELAGQSGVRALAVGAMHACLLRDDGTVWCWGSNGQYELGTGDTSGSFAPRQVLASPGVPLAGAVAIDSSNRHSCALMADATVRCWGQNTDHQLGYDPLTGGDPGYARAVPSLAGVAQVAAGAYHTCARLTDGSVRCWGDNTVGQIGQGYTSPAPQPITAPAAVAGVAGAVQLAAGIRHSCAVVGSGAVHCWGSGWMGNGNGAELQSLAGPVAGLAGVTALDAGDAHTCVLRDSGALQCWGSNADGALGTGDTDPRATPAASGGGWWP